MANSLYINKFENKSKAAWHVVSRELGINNLKTKSKIVLKGINDEEISNARTIVEQFNDFFTNIVSRINVKKATAKGVRESVKNKMPRKGTIIVQF